MFGLLWVPQKSVPFHKCTLQQIRTELTHKALLQEISSLSTRNVIADVTWFRASLAIAKILYKHPQNIFSWPLAFTLLCKFLKVSNMPFLHLCKYASSNFSNFPTRYSNNATFTLNPYSQPKRYMTAWWFTQTANLFSNASVLTFSLYKTPVIMPGFASFIKKPLITNY